MSFNRKFNAGNDIGSKFILGNTSFKSAPSTSGPTVSLNNDNDLVIKSTPNSAEPISKNNNENDDLIHMLESMNHPDQQALKESHDDDRMIKKLISDDKLPVKSTTTTTTVNNNNNNNNNEVTPEMTTNSSSSSSVNSTSSSDAEVEIEELNEKKPLEEDNDDDNDDINDEKPANNEENLIDLGAPPMQHGSSSQAVVQLKTEPSSTGKASPPKDTIEEAKVTEEAHSDSGSEEVIPFDFQEFLKKLKYKECEPIIKYLKSFMRQFGAKSWAVDEQARLVKDFEAFVFDKFIQIDRFSQLSLAEQNNVKEGFEKLVMSRLYTQVFPPALINTPKLTASHKEELLQDLKLAENFIKFQWIENKHLDIPDLMMSNSQSFIDLSANELGKLNNYKSPRDKIICILNCCKVIYGLIRKQQMKLKLEENADTFVPLMIYIILKSKPKHLISNVNYIERFRNDVFLNGESMYYLSSLQLAANFILKVDYKALTIEEDEFNENVAKTEAELKARKQVKESTSNRILSPVPLISGKLNDERLQDLSPSQILATSANALQQKFSQIFATDESQEAAQADEHRRGASGDKDILSKVKKLSIKEHEEQVNSTKKEEEVFTSLKSIFPNIEDEILKDIIVLKNYNIGDCIDSCLELAG